MRFAICLFSVLGVACQGPDPLPGAVDFAGNSAARSATANGPDGVLEDYGISCDFSISDGVATTRLRSTSEKDVRFLAWDTTWDRNSDAVVLVDTASGLGLGYHGPVMRRVESEQSYITIPAGAEITSEYPLGAWYGLEEGQTLRARLRQSRLRLKVGSDFKDVAVNCGSSESTFHRAEGGELAQSLLEPWPSCTDIQTERINRAIGGAYLLAHAALQDFDNLSKSHERRWFGNESNSPRVAYQRMLTEDELVRCGGSACDNGDLGRVMDYGYDQKLYLCAPLWDKPYMAMNSYSWSEVLVHELAHLVDQPDGSIVDWENPSCDGFGDRCYEYPNAVQLATHCTECAQRNAENYAGFAAEAFMRPALMIAVLY